MNRRQLLALCLLALPLSAIAAQPFLEKSELFKVGKENDYTLYHIPGIVVTSKGTVLAYCEARKGGGGDWAQIDVLLRRSTDSGKSFDAPRLIAHRGDPVERNPLVVARKLGKATDQTVNNPVAIVDSNGSVHFLYCIEYAHCFYMRSDDDGLTFSKPVDITPAFEKFRPEYAWTVLATGPNHGIQLKNGRLVVPVWLSTGTGGNGHRPSVTSVIYSDDHGAAWQRGDIAVPHTTEFVNPNETVVVQLADGRTLLNVRNESKNNRRIVVTSPDGATGWSKPRFDESLKEPICMAAIIRVSEKPAADKNRIVFVNPDNLERADKKEAPGKNRDRKNLSAKLSYDEGETWAVTKVIDPDWSGYSDIAVAHDGTLLSFYGRGEKSGFAFDNLTLARFNLEWLTDSADALAK